MFLFRPIRVAFVREQEEHFLEIGKAISHGKQPYTFYEMSESETKPRSSEKVQLHKGPLEYRGLVASYLKYLFSFLNKGRQVLE